MPASQLVGLLNCLAGSLTDDVRDFLSQALEAQAEWCARASSPRRQRRAALLSRPGNVGIRVDRGPRLVVVLCRGMGERRRVRGVGRERGELCRKRWELWRSAIEKKLTLLHPNAAIFLATGEEDMAIRGKGDGIVRRTSAQVRRSMGLV